MARDKTEPDRTTVTEALQRQFPNDWQAIQTEMVWDSIMECWLVRRWGMTIGIERDGYAHS